VVTVPEIPICYKIAALVREQNLLFAYPVERLASVIRDVGFKCTCCARCCTRSFNGHVFLLDHDVLEVRSIEPEALEPAPDPEFCDHNGTFYVSGYALRTKNDPAGSCWFLEGGRCRIYDRRFSICRVYPYMLHREPGADGRIDYRQISGLDEHGEYHHFIPDDECLALARETKEYENAFLAHEISFLEYMQEYFSRHGLRHSRVMYRRQMQRFSKGHPVTVMVYHDGTLEPHQVSQSR
jgi:Fe-S-cluster containining protein